MLLGIDIGGTTINMGLVKGSDIVVKKTVPSFKQEWNKQQTLDYLCDEISGIIKLIQAFKAQKRSNFKTDKDRGVL